MSTEIIVALVGALGIVLGSVLANLLSRKKMEAEIEKISAETKKAHAEADKLRAEINQLNFPMKERIENIKSNDVISPKRLGKEANELETGDYKERPTPSEILQSLDNLTEYQISLTLEGYKNIKVRWNLNIMSLEFKDDVITLGLYSTDVKGFPIIAKVNAIDYPQLRILKKNEMIRVSGEIEKIYKVAGYAVILKDCILEV